MKIQVLSDLHLEFGHPFEVTRTNADVVVLAGDIHLGTAGIRWAQATFSDQPVVYVAGNHEFYKHHWTKLLVELRRAAAGSNVHFLEDDEVLLGGLRFLGCTLWTDFALLGEEQRQDAMLEAEANMSDYKKIRAPRVRPGFKDDYSKLKPIQTLARFRRSLEFLEKRLRISFDGPTVVVTHHLPSQGPVHSRYAGSLASAAYASDLTNLIGRCKPNAWIHGHVHVSMDYQVGLTQMVCNPRGYPLKGRDFENSSFDGSKVINV
jgi:Icc-related predicted phosphoesterase